MKTVVIAPDSFKGSISASDAARALAEGWTRVRPGDTIVLRPMADGGEGTLDAFAMAVRGALRMPVTVDGPHHEPVDSEWLLLPPTPQSPRGIGVVELARTSGIEVLGGLLNPWGADTRGFGEAIAAALDHGVSSLVVGIGSSASTDGGMGALTALGARFTDRTGALVLRGLRGLATVEHADLSLLRPVPPGGAIVLTDVSNPLLGPRGAAKIFGPQKGLDAEGMMRADQALSRLAGLLATDPSAQGAGAAGGAGYGMLAWGATLTPGARDVGRLIGLADAVANADIVVTGEGSFDGQSAEGKAPAHVAELARAAGIRAGLAAGRIARDADLGEFSATEALDMLSGSSEAALAEPAKWLREAGSRLGLALGNTTHP